MAPYSSDLLRAFLNFILILGLGFNSEATRHQLKVTRCDRDDLGWRSMKGQESCTWVEMKPSRRCDREGEDGRNACDACCEACSDVDYCNSNVIGYLRKSAPLEPVVIKPQSVQLEKEIVGKCENDPEWKEYETLLGCDWVAYEPEQRCVSDDIDGTGACDGCCEACAGVDYCKDPEDQAQPMLAMSAKVDQKVLDEVTGMCEADEPAWIDEASNYSCSWIANKPEQRCVREDKNEVGACEACCKTCAEVSYCVNPPDEAAEESEHPEDPDEAGEVVPNEPCNGDDPSWRDDKSGGVETCAWVAIKPERRCDRVGIDGREAFVGCCESCSGVLHPETAESVQNVVDQALRGKDKVEKQLPHFGHGFGGL